MKSLASRVVLLLVAVLPAWSHARAQDTPAPDALLADAAQRLAAIGYDVPEGMRDESRDARQVIADVDAQQELFLPADAFLLQHALLSRLGLPAGRDAAALRQQTLASMVRGLSAYYDPIRKAFVVLPTMSRDVGEVLAGSMLPLLTHELVHAHQDTRDGGLRGYFGVDGRTLDTGMARRCAVEGEAEIAALVALRGDAAVAQLAGQSMSGMLDRLFGGELTGQIYEAGRRLAAARHAQGGMAAVGALWQQPPLSTEQAMHAGKYGSDVPTAVTVPDVPGLTRAHATTIGELLIFHLLRQSGVGRLDASLAGTGWDGDQFVLFDRGEEAGVAVAWRSVWDRDEDAADFAVRLRTTGHGVVAQQGRLVDWVASDDDDLQSTMLGALAADRVQPPADENDAASTAAAEAELRAELDQARIDGAFWRHEALGLAVPIRAGWEVREVNGVKMLMHLESAKTGFAINVNVTGQPSGDLADLDALIAATRMQFERMKLTVDKCEVAVHDDVEVVDGEYHGRLGSMAPMRFLTLAFLRGDQQIWVTATATEKLWPDHEQELRALMAGIRITPP